MCEVYKGMKMTRVLKRVKQQEQKQILLTLSDGVKKLELNQIYFIVSAK